MRLLVGLAIVQSVLLGIIGVKVIALDARIEKLARTPALTAAEPESAAAPRRQIAAVSGATSAEVRQIVREEVAVLLQGKIAQAAYAGNNAPRVPMSSEEASLQKAAVQRDLDMYVAQGEIGEAEMGALQEKIGALPAAERREMLSKLTKALISGRLQGQL